MENNTTRPTFGSMPLMKPLVTNNMVVAKPETAPIVPIQPQQSSIDVGPTSEQLRKWNSPSELLPYAFNIASKIRALGSEIKSIIVERNDLIDSCMLALITANHLIMLGDPGIAKSMLSREIFKRISGSKYFEYLLTKTTDPSEILGPHSIKMMEQDSFSRKTTGFIPKSEIVFLDEMFKCNSAALNTLLAITNERIFHDDGKAKQIPLISLFGASNEEPDDPSLNALYDRMLFRFIVEPVGEPVNRLKMYDGYLSRRIPSAQNKPLTTVSIEELTDIRMAARYVTIPKDILNQYDTLMMDLKQKNQISITDRRKNEGLGILQGAAILCGRDVVSIDDFVHLIPVWWQRPEDIKTIRDKVNKVANPFEAKLSEHRESISAILKRIDEAAEGQRPQIVVEARALLNQVHSDVAKMISEARKLSKDTVKLEEMRQFVYSQQKEILNKHLGVDDSTLQPDTGLGSSIDDFQF